jgi:ATP-dependent helicase/nuclease subunit A
MSSEPEVRTLADQDVRDAIAGQLRETFLVEAAAGTGKTTSLVRRMASLVREGEIEAGELAAITFTIKAAAHLRERFQVELETQLLSATGEKRERLARARGRLATAFIGTIHAFCARMLRERPIEAGLDPGFEELSESEAGELPLDFWDRYTQRLFVNNDPILTELALVGVQPQHMSAMFVKLNNYPDVELVAVERPRPSLHIPCGEVIDFLERAEQDLLPYPEGEQFGRLLMSARRLCTLMQFDDDLAILRLLEKFEVKAGVTQQNWPDKKKVKRWADDYEALRATTVEPVLRSWREHVHGILIRAMRPAFQEFAEERRRSGKQTFQDLLMNARDLLRDHSNVRAYFQRRFKRVLVDEFQDTDPIQAEIVFYLTSPDTRERDWMKLRPASGSLFIVGDPKQSIYRFRRADITIYSQVKSMILESGGEVLQLTTNFRSVPEICTWVNGFFKNVFTEEALQGGRQAAHVDVFPERGAVPGGGVFHLDTASTGTDRKAEDVAANEAQCVADWIDRYVRSGSVVDDGKEQRSARYADFLLIAWNTTHLDVYARALEARGIPYEVTGAQAFAQGDELRQLLPFLKAIVEPDDAYAIVGHLRGPLCGVDDQALFDFVHAGGRFSFFRELAADADPRIVAAFGMMKEAHGWVRELPPAAVIARVIDRLGLLARSVSGDQSGTRSGNLLKSLAMARKMSSDGESLATIVAHFERIIRAKEKIEEMDLEPARDDVVRLMNLHQAKGLEAPFVFLIDPNDPTWFKPDSYIERLTDPPGGHFVLSVKFGRKTKVLGLPFDWDRKMTVESDFKEREEERLLYVAATRAKNALVVGIQRRQNKGGAKAVGPWSVFDPNLTRLFPRAVSAPAAVAAAPGGDLDVSRMRLELQERQASAAEVSYSVLPITKIAHLSHARLTKVEEGLGRGTSWGRVLHRLFEAMLRDDSFDLPLYAANLLKDEERDAADLAEVLRVVEAVQKSELWQRAVRSPERYVEVPFAIVVPSRDFGLEGPRETLLHGIIDLVFREAERWFVVDYKSDSTAGGRLPSLIEYYRPQVEHYARFWSKLTGAEATGGLFFVDGSMDVWL